VVCVQSRTDADRIELRDAGLDRLEAHLRGGSRIVGHHVAYDAACSIATRPRLLALWFDAYENDRVTCTLVREKIIRIAQGSSDRYASHGIVDCLERYKIPHAFEAGDKAKDGTSWRTRYGALDGVPVAAWPPEALRYALADLDVSAVYEAQEQCPPRVLVDQHRQARADFWLYLQKARGMRTDPEAIRAFGRKVEIEHERHRETCTAAGIVRSDGSRDTKAAAGRMREVCAAKGLTVALTKTGKARVKAEELTHADALAEYTALDADACAATADPILRSYARYGSVGTLRRRAERLDRAGSIPIQPYFDVLKKTGRTSSSMGDVKPGKPLLAFGDQVQNLNREPGLRECYIARPGYVLASVDWSSAELHSLAQVCIWLGLRSRLAEVLREGRDPHLHFACVQHGWEYAWAVGAMAGKHGPDARKAVKDARQWAKPFNFGFPGGLGIEKFRIFAAKAYEIELTDDQARAGKAAWMATYPEMVDYFRHINDLIESGAPLVHFMSERYRGDLRYTAAANSYFQGHTADMAKDAGWILAREYAGIDPGPLSEAFAWNFVHDEHIAEVPEITAHECASRMQAIMEAAGRRWCPDLGVPAEPALSRRWRKGAGPVYRYGRLIPYEDRAMDPETREKIRAALASGTDPVHASWSFGFETHTILEAAA
jgi:hypothetical protein